MCCTKYGTITVIFTQHGFCIWRILFYCKRFSKLLIYSRRFNSRRMCVCFFQHTEIQRLLSGVYVKCQDWASSKCLQNVSKPWRKAVWMCDEESQLNQKWHEMLGQWDHGHYKSIHILMYKAKKLQMTSAKLFFTSITTKHIKTVQRVICMMKMWRHFL